MRALKALVIGMGVLIVAGLIVVVVTIANRGGVARPTGFDTAGLGLPAGSEIAAIEAVGDRLAVHVRIPGEGDRILIVDPADGTIVGRIAPEGAP